MSSKISTNSSKIISKITKKTSIGYTHRVKVLTPKQVEANRCSAYTYLNLG